MKFSWTGKTSSAMDSLRLVLWAQSKGRNEEFMAALGWRHFGHGMKLADWSVLTDAAAEAGLDRVEALEVLKSRRFERDLEVDMIKFTRDRPECASIEARVSGAWGAIPVFTFRTTNPSFTGKAETLAGSQPQEAFEGVLERLEDLEE